MTPLMTPPMTPPPTAAAKPLPRWLALCLGLAVHVATVAIYGAWVVAEPLRRGMDGGVPSSPAAVVTTAVVQALFTGLLFVGLLLLARRGARRGWLPVGLGLLYGGVWCLAAGSTAFEYRMFFGNTWNNWEILFELVLQKPPAQGLLLVAWCCHLGLLQPSLRLGPGPETTA